MRERDYRESRFCRILGNPTAYRILILLLDGSRRKPTELSLILDRSLVTVSLTLRILRNADLVRYEHVGRDTWYWIKYSDETRLLIRALRAVVQRASRRIRKDR